MNKLVFALIFIQVLFASILSAQVGIGTTNPNPSSILDISSSNKGILIPRTDTLNVVNPGKGLIICDTSTTRGLNYFYYTGTYWKPLGANAGSFADSFNGNRTVKRAGIPNVNVGTTTNVADFLNAYFFPFIASTISINGYELYEIGTSQSINISGATTANDETSFSNGKVDEVYAGLGTVYTFGSALSYSYSGVTFSPNASIPASLEYRFIAKQDVANNGSPTTISSWIKYVQSCYPYFYGVNAANLTTGGTAAYSGLSKLIQTKSNKTVSLTGSNGYIYFCYPAAYGPLSSILDQNLFNSFGAFTRFTANITSVGLTNNWTTSYYIYQSNNTTSPAGWNYQFIY